MLIKLFRMLTVFSLIIFTSNFFANETWIPKISIDKAQENSKGTILLIHGTAAQNIDGQVPDKLFQQRIKKEDPNHYIIQPTFKELAMNLNMLRWDTIRYTRLGVYQDHINMDEYKKTDLKNIMDQLNDIWGKMPKNKPRIAFAWSGGSVHVSLLPLSDADGVIILGGIATKRFDVYRQRAKTEKELEEINKKINDILINGGDEKGREEVTIDGPDGRFFDENKLNENWTYYKNYPKLPILIIHGDRDAEVNLSQAKLWKEKLPKNNITLIIIPFGNHALGKEGNRQDMKTLAKIIDNWLTENVLKTNIKNSEKH